MAMKVTIACAILFASALIASSLDVHRVRRATDSERHKMSKVMKIVEVAKLQDCIARVICALNCDADGYGPDGKVVFQMMLAIQTSGAINETETRYYLNAGMTGRRFRQNATCTSCVSTYSDCQICTQDLVDIASLVKLS